MITDASDDCFLVCFISREEKRLLRGGEILTEVPGQYKGGQIKPGKNRGGESCVVVFHREAPLPINNKDSVIVDKHLIHSTLFKITITNHLFFT